ncbi:hypothetical protein [Desulfosporosinus sp. SB140]|uniref:hypothetical protein n=1 Tax=Desulfosporosinus paludis TaxID=3115649 RepID=UPI00388D5A11
MKRTDQAPKEYVEMVYRREFGYTPEEMDKIPTYIVERDLYFMSQESTIQKLLQGGD